jgi:hypothetical protein
MTEYNLPSFSTVAGTFKLHLYATSAGLTVPTINTVLELGETKESANISVGISEIGNMQIRLRDDDSTYSQGFWYKVLQDETRLRIYLDEGAGDTFYFFGYVEPGSIKWDEHYIGSTRIRTVSLTLISAMRIILDSKIDDWITEVLANCTATGHSSLSAPSHIMKVTELFACMLSMGSSPLNPDFNPATDISFLYGSQTQLQWGDGVSLYAVSSLYVPVKYYFTTAPEDIRPVVYFDTTKTTCLARQSDGTGFYDSMQAFLKDLLANFGLIMRTTYDAALERHVIQLSHRGDVYSGELSFSGREKSSAIMNGTRLLGDAARAMDLLQETNFIWMSKSYSRFPSPLDPPQAISFDLDVKCPFIIDSSGSGEGNHSLMKWTSGAVVYMTGGKYYSTISGLMTVAYSTDPNKMEEMATSYQFEWFTTYHATVNRVYGKMLANGGSGETHTVLEIMRRVSINDLDSTRTFFANAVTKNPATNEVSVEWIEE